MTLTMFAATGFTQVGWFLKLGLMWAAIFYMLSRVVLGWKVWSWKPVLLAVVLALGVGLLFTPWSSLTEIKSNDPDVLSWHRRFYVTTIAWMFAAGASVLSLGFLCMLRHGPSAPGLWLFVWRPWKHYRDTYSAAGPKAGAARHDDVIVQSERIPNAPSDLKMAQTPDPAPAGKAKR